MKTFYIVIKGTCIILNGELGIMFEELKVQISMQKNRKAVQLPINGNRSSPDLF